MQNESWAFNTFLLSDHKPDVFTAFLILICYFELWHHFCASLHTVLQRADLV